MNRADTTGAEATSTAEPHPPAAADAAKLRRRVAAKLAYQVGRDPELAGERDWFVAAALAARDRVVDRWTACERRFRSGRGKLVCYLSLEFLPGRLLGDALGKLGLTEAMRAALAEAGVDFGRVLAQEPDPALGNGGLGRLAACYLESMASLGVAAYGYGIRYDHGLFRQVIHDGVQHELPEDWLARGNPWEFERPEVTYAIGFGGSVAAMPAAGGGEARYVWHPAETITAAAYDTPVVGRGAEQINTLRLWSARANDPLRLEDFNRGDHVGALSERMRAEAISRVLYPGDDTPAGQELRLRQEYFFAAASLQDILRRHLRRFAGDPRSLPAGAAIQLNDTHPAIGVAELMRLLVDVHGLGWDEAWGITRSVFSYTNHTLLPEALEAWPVPLVERLLPRHMQIIYLLNTAHLGAVRATGAADGGALAAVSLIDEHHGRRVRMGHLAFVGSHRVNGVSALHTDLMRRTVFRELDGALPGRIVNKTNGVSFRRWLHGANPRLTGLLVEALGERVLTEPEQALEGLAPLAGDAGFRDRFRAQRRQAKAALSDHIASQIGVAVDPEALFDVQIKRVHEYKRQLLNVLHTVALYDALRAQPMQERAPRVKLLAGKAAAGYREAKLIIRLAHDVAKVINNDPTVRDRLRVAFLPNYNVSLAERIIPAADLSEQISTAGMEASGTGNMKLALNGALTIGTLDGANVEIRERVGAENVFIFGLTVEEVEARRHADLDVRAVVEASPVLSEVLDAVAGGVFSPDEPDRYRGLVEALLLRDRFMVLADFEAYRAAQRAVSDLWREPAAWWRASVLNTAHVGWFSSDRAVCEYAEEIWGVPTRPSV